MALKDKLGFSLHSFQRVTWASEALKAEWELRLAVLPEAINDVFTSPAVMELLPVHVANVHVTKLYEYKKKMYSKGLFAEHVHSIPPNVQYAFGVQPEFNHLHVFTGYRRSVVDFIAHLQDTSELDSIAQLPKGTIHWWNEFTGHNLVDKQWAYLLGADGNFDQKKIYETGLLNSCWSWLGISALPYNACTPNCPVSESMAANIRSIAQDLLPANVCEDWYEILSWPTEWSALHGIGEIKTPLFKMIYNSDASGTKYTLQFKSGSYPRKGLNGLLFPYRKPDKLLISDSEKFKLGTRDAYHEPNSFFRYDGKLYDLNSVLQITKKIPVITFPVEELSWILYNNDVSPDRVEKADLSYPLLISEWRDKFVVLDGTHRLAKAVAEGVKDILVKIISPDLFTNFTTKRTLIDTQTDETFLKKIE